MNLRLACVVLTALLGILDPPAMAASEGRYQIVPLTDASGGLGSDRVFVLDTLAGHMWTWTEVPAGNGSTGGRFLIYQGQVRPGSRIGEVIEQQDWKPEPEPTAPAPRGKR